MTAGSVLPAVRARLVELLAARMVGVTVGYHPPRHHVDLAAPTGSQMEAVWLDGSSTAEGVEPASLGSPVRIEESWTQTVVVQVLGRDTDDSQEDLDVRCGLILGEVENEVSINPRLGLTVEGWGPATVTLRAWRWQSGVLIRGAGVATANSRVELDLSVRASRC